MRVSTDEWFNRDETKTEEKLKFGITNHDAKTILYKYADDIGRRFRKLKEKAGIKFKGGFYEWHCRAETGCRTQRRTTRAGGIGCLRLARVFVLGAAGVLVADWSRALNVGSRLFASEVKRSHIDRRGGLRDDAKMGITFLKQCKTYELDKGVVFRDMQTQ